MKKILVNSLLVLGAVIFSLLIAEGISRIVFSPGDYLMPEIIRDKWGARVKPGSPGHDSWGFRNSSVPSRPDIVAIGDSNTYGVAAIGYNSWPAQLGRITGKTVYNLGMPGYGPVTYDHLLNDYALGLRPSMVIVGFYLGNDAWGAYKAIYKNNHHPDLKNPDFVSGLCEDGGGIDSAVATGPLPLEDVRRWLSLHSILYNVARYSEVFRLALDRFESRNENGYSILEDSRNGIKTVLQPKGLRAVNLSNPAVREGLRISLEIISEMNKTCRAEDIKFLVVLIPSKLAVYYEYVKDYPELKNYEELMSWGEYERRMNELVRSFFQERGISYIDTLGPLREATHREQVYPGNADTHPNRNGYGIIAEVVAESLDWNSPSEIEK